MNVRKGPYYADVGDFSSAGSVTIDYLNKLPKNLAEVTVGSFGYRRGVAAGSTAVGAGTMLAAIEGIKYEGPWDVPDNVRKINGVLRYSQGTATDGLTLTAMAYSNGWNSTDQVAQRAIDQGIISRFGTLDPTDGGTSSRFSLSGNWAQSSEYGQSKISAYVVRSDLQLFNNFTYFLDNPVNGDQFNQLDRRTLGGFDARHAFDWRFGGFETQNEQIKTIWFQAVTEAGSNPSKEQVLRAYAAQYSAMEGANEIATLAIRTCGGQAMLKSLPLERIYRDSRCGSLMLPWTAELCLDRIGREALYETGELDD